MAQGSLADQRTSGSADLQRTCCSGLAADLADLRIRGPADQGISGLADQQISGSDLRMGGPADQPADQQRTKNSRSQVYHSSQPFHLRLWKQLVSTWTDPETDSLTGTGSIRNASSVLIRNALLGVNSQRVVVRFCKC